MSASNSATSLGAAAIAEKAEARYFERFEVRAPQADRNRLGIASKEVGDGIAVAMRDDGNSYWNKALGFGFEQPLNDQVVIDALQFFHETGSRTAVIAAAPSVLPPDWEQICKNHGLVATTSWAKLLCPIDRFSGGSTELDVRALTDADTASWADLTRVAFGLSDPDLTPFLRACIADPVARVFGAWDRDQLVGAGAVYLFDEVASLNTGATSPTHRRRGVQSALLTARADAAKNAGCRWMAAETGSPDLSGVGNASFRNLRKAGFEHLYDRINWRWHNPKVRTTPDNQTTMDIKGANHE